MVLCWNGSLSKCVEFSAHLLSVDVHCLFHSTYIVPSASTLMCTVRGGLQANAQTELAKLKSPRNNSWMDVVGRGMVFVGKKVGLRVV